MKKLLIGMIVLFFLINTTSANYTRNIDDDFKIYELEQKIGKIIERSNNQEILKQKLIFKVKNVLGKTDKELNSIGNFKDYNIKSFKEYIFIKIYRYLSYGDLIRYKDSEVSILENDFVKVLVTLPSLGIDDDSVYYSLNNGTKRKMIEFFKIKPDENIEDFINEKFIEKKYDGKCKAYIKSEKIISFTKNQVFGIGAYGDYALAIHKNIGDIPDCGYYGDSNSITYFERRRDYLIYVNAGQDYSGLDFSLIEFK